jgi:diamine N-acetyltransferase
LKTLEGKILALRPLEPDDLDILYKWENDPGNWKVSQTITPFSKDLLIKYLENSHLDIFQVKQLRLVIVVKKSGKPAGLIDLFDFDPFHQRAGIGVLIGNSEDRKKGYAGEALEILLEYCFNTLILNQVFCNILDSNASSKRLFEKAGFVKSGTRVQWIRTADGWEDESFYRLLRQEWLSSRS